MLTPVHKWLFGTFAVVGVLALANQPSTPTPLNSAAQTAAVANYQQPAAYVAPTPTPVPQIFTTTLSLYDSGTDVANVQQFLADEGLYSGSDNGSYDQATVDAVKAFEYQEGITPADGFWGYDAQTKANTIMASHPDWVTYLSNNNSYTNVNGSTVQSPADSSNGIPAGASAQCGDGTYSFSMHHSGTCSHHGGVSQWLQ